MISNKKAQISIEFIFVVGAVLVIFLIILAFSFEKTSDIRKMKAETELLDECNKVSNAILNTIIIGDKGIIKASVSNTVDIFDYGIISINNGVSTVECNYIGKIDTTLGLKKAITFTNTNGNIMVG